MEVEREVDSYDSYDPNINYLSPETEKELDDMHRKRVEDELMRRRWNEWYIYQEAQAAQAAAAQAAQRAWYEEQLRREWYARHLYEQQERARAYKRWYTQVEISGYGYMKGYKH